MFQRSSKGADSKLGDTNLKMRDGTIDQINRDSYPLSDGDQATKKNDPTILLKNDKYTPESKGDVSPDRTVLKAKN